MTFQKKRENLVLCSAADPETQQEDSGNNKKNLYSHLQSPNLFCSVFTEGLLFFLNKNLQTTVAKIYRLQFQLFTEIGEYGQAKEKERCVQVRRNICVEV